MKRRAHPTNRLPEFAATSEAADWLRPYVHLFSSGGIGAVSNTRFRERPLKSSTTNANSHIATRSQRSAARNWFARSAPTTGQIFSSIDSMPVPMNSVTSISCSESTPSKTQMPSRREREPERFPAAHGFFICLSTDGGKQADVASTNSRIAQKRGHADMPGKRSRNPRRGITVNDRKVATVTKNNANETTHNTRAANVGIL
jgi:hypothetical protein